MKIDLIFNGKHYRNWTLDELLAAGVTQAAIDAHFADERVKAIKVECRRRIYAIASPEAQMNVSTAQGAAAAKTASSRSAADNALIAGAAAGIGWVAAMRGNIATLAADPAADILADASWPLCPQEAVEIYSQF